MKFRLLSLLILNTLFLNAQNTATISGRVIEKTTGQVLSYATVVLNTLPEKIFTAGTITDDEGIFIFKDINPGSYILNISFTGFEPFLKEILIGKINNFYDLGKIELDQTLNTLAEIQITAEREEVSASMEKKSFSIDNNISQAGGSVLRAIQNLPGITVDTEGKVYLRGSDKVTVLIDGKQSSLTGYGTQIGLDNIPASNIERVEIINNPSSKFDSRGMAGIVNIIYKKEKKKGFNGEVGLAAGLGELSTRRNNLPGIMEKYKFTPKLTPDISLNYKKEKINLFLQSDGMLRRKINTNEFTIRDYSDSDNNDIISQFLENRTQQLYNIKAGADLYLNNKNTLTLYALWEDEYHVDRGDVPYEYLFSGDRYRMWQWAEDEDTKFINFSAQYSHDFIQPGHRLDAGYIFTGGREDELFPFNDSSSLRNSTDETHLVAGEYVHSINLDYVKPLVSGRIETGIKMSLRHLPIEFQVLPGINSVLDINIGSYSEYYEDIIAGYLNYVFESQNVEIEGGTRVEQSFIRYEIDPANIYLDRNDKYNYFSLFPNIRITYKLNEKNRLSAFLNRRIDRPGEFDLRPFPKYDDPEILKTGNPFLRPQYTQTYELSYRKGWKSGSAYLSVFHRTISDIYSRIYTTDTLSSYNVVNTIPANLGTGTNTGFELYAENEIAGCFNLKFGFNWYRNHINEFSGTHYYPYQQIFSFPNTKSNTWNARLNASFESKKDLIIQISAVYYAPDIIPQGKVNDRYTLDSGISKKMLNENLEVYVNANDILNSFTLKTTITGNNFTLNKTNYLETQTVMAGIKYKF